MDLRERSLKLDKWAVVGATDKRERYGYKIVKILKEHGYDVFPVNPKLDQVAGLKCFASLAEIPEQIEVVDLVVNPKTGLKVMSDVIKLGIEYVWLQPGARSDELKDFASKNGVNIIEDCIYARLR